MFLPRLAVLTSCVFLLAGKKIDPPQVAPADRALHALNRLTFGPRQGDVERVERLGLGRWIEQQLNPEGVSENNVLEAKLAPLETPPAPIAPTLNFAVLLVLETRCAAVTIVGT